MKSELEKYNLWYDGYIEVKSEDVLKFSKYHKLCVDTLTDNIRQFNRFSDEKILVKDSLEEFDLSWNIPARYLEIDVREYVLAKLEENSEDLSEDEIIIRIRRIRSELRVFNELNLNNLLRTMIYIVDRFIETSTVWGVGRGSSVSSYVLYLIGIHDVDSVEYELDFSDFLEVDSYVVHAG